MNIHVCIYPDTEQIGKQRQKKKREQNGKNLLQILYK